MITLLVAASSVDCSVGDISTTTSDHATSVDIDDEKEQAPGQSVEPESKMVNEIHLYHRFLKVTVF